MAIARLVGQNASNTSSAATVTATYASTPTQNNLMIAVLYSSNTQANCSITGWTHDVGEDDTNGHSINIFSKVAGAGESTSIVANSTGSGSMHLLIFEYSGCATTTPTDKTAVNTSGAGTASSLATGTTATTTVANELLIAAAGVAGSGSVPTWTNTFTAENNTTRAFMADRIVAATGTYSSTFGYTGTAVQVNAGIATYKAAGGTVNTSALTGGLSFSGTINKKTTHNLLGFLMPKGYSGLSGGGFASGLFGGPYFGGGYQASSGGGLTKKTSHNMSGGVSFVGSIAKSLRRLLTAAASFVGVLAGVKNGGATQYTQALTAALSFTGSQTKRAGKTALSASVSFVGTQLKLTAHGLTAGLSFVGSISKRAIKPLSAAVSFIGSFVSGAMHLLTMTASLSFVGAFSKRSGKLNTAALNLSGAVGRRTNRPMGAGLILSGGNPNLFDNGDFERAPSFTAATTSTNNFFVDGTATGSATDLGYHWRSGIFNSGAVQFDTAQFHSGTTSFKLSTTGAGSYIEARYITGGYWGTSGVPLLPNTAYTLTFWMKTNYVSGDSTNGATIQFIESDIFGNSVNHEAGSSAVKTTTNWTQYTINLTTTATTNWGHCELRIYGHTGAGTLIMDAWFDDIVMAPTQLGSFTKQTSRAYTASLSFAGAIGRRAIKVLAAAVSFATFFSDGARHQLVLLASLGFSGTLNKFTTYPLPSAALSFVGSNTKQTRRAVAGALSYVSTFTTSLIHAGTHYTQALAGMVSFSVAVGGTGSGVSDSYSESFKSYNIDNFNTAFLETAQSFTAANTANITAAKFYLFRTGTPTGNVTAKIYAHSGTYGTSSIPTGSPLATSAPIAIGAVSNAAYGLVTFTFGTPLAVTAGTHYEVAFSVAAATTDSSNKIQAGGDATTVSHSGNEAGLFGASWLSSNSVDVCFYVLDDSALPIPQFTKQIDKLNTAALNFAGALSKFTARTMAGAVSFIGQLLDGARHQLVLLASLAFSGSLAKRTNRGLTASVSFVGAITRRIGKGVLAVVSFVGSIATFKSHTGTLYNMVMTASVSFVGRFPYTGGLPPSLIILTDGRIAKWLGGILYLPL